MEQDWLDIAKRRMKKLGITQDDLKGPLGVKTRGAVGHYLAGRREMSAEQLRALATALEWSVDQLLTGGQSREGDQTESVAVLEPISDIVLRHVPIVGTTQAGPDAHWEELGYPVGYGEEYVDTPSFDRNAYALRVRGGSMGLRIREGEAVVVSPNSEAMPGEEVVVKTHDGRVMVKELAYRRRGEIALDSIGVGYDRIVLREQEIEFMHAVVSIVPASRIRHR